MRTDYRELVALVNLLKEGESELTVDEISDKAYEYYRDERIFFEQYDRIMGMMQNE